MTSFKLPLNNEGLYANEDGRLHDHNDKIADHEDINSFVDRVFKEFPPGTTSLSYEQYSYFNKMVSSEMFYSLMSLMHSRLPCA
jgi:hypothetical protein